nr:MAG TPA: hypothetical protein [Caudoviricetes sp.]
MSEYFLSPSRTTPTFQPPLIITHNGGEGRNRTYV